MFVDSEGKIDIPCSLFFLSLFFLCFFGSFIKHTQYHFRLFSHVFNVGSSTDLQASPLVSDDEISKSKI